MAQHTFAGRVATPEMALEVGDACCWSRLTRLPCLQDSNHEFPLGPWSALGLCPVMLSRTKDQGPGNQQGSINDVGDDQTNRVCVRVPVSGSNCSAEQPGSCVRVMAPHSSHCPQVGADVSCVLPWESSLNLREAWAVLVSSVTTWTNNNNCCN